MDYSTLKIIRAGRDKKSPIKNTTEKANQTMAAHAKSITAQLLKLAHKLPITQQYLRDHRSRYYSNKFPQKSQQQKNKNVRIQHDSNKHN